MSSRTKATLSYQVPGGIASHSVLPSLHCTSKLTKVSRDNQRKDVKMQAILLRP